MATTDRGGLKIDMTCSNAEWQAEARVCAAAGGMILMAEIKNGGDRPRWFGTLAPNVLLFQPCDFFGSGASPTSSKAAIGHEYFHRLGAPGLAAISSSS